MVNSTKDFPVFSFKEYKMGALTRNEFIGATGQI